MLGPLGLLAHESKIVDHLWLVKTATFFFALLVAADHHSMLQSLDVNVHPASLKNCLTVLTLLDVLPCNPYCHNQWL